jgi:hypothetical protein
MSFLSKFIKRSAGAAPRPRSAARRDGAGQELPDDLLDQVAGGGNPPTNTVDSTGSMKSM